MADSTAAWWACPSRRQEAAVTTMISERDWTHHARHGCQCDECYARAHVADAMRGRRRARGWWISHVRSSQREAGGAIELRYPDQLEDWIRNVEHGPNRYSKSDS